MELAEKVLRALVVDADAAQRAATVALLHGMGIAGLRVLEADTTEGAVSQAEERPRLVVVAPRMLAAGVNSADVVRRIKQMLGDGTYLVVWGPRPLGPIGTRALLDAGADAVLLTGTADELQEDLDGVLP